MAIARFLRAFQVLLKATRLYDLNHPQVQENLSTAEQELRAAQISAKPRNVALKVQAGQVINAASGHPVQDPRGELRALAEELARRGVTKLVFTQEVNLGELASLTALLAGKTPHLGPRRTSPSSAEILSSACSI